MKASLGLPSMIGLLAALLAAALPSSRGNIIDFNSIADDTPVSAGNPYGGALDIQAQTGWQDLDLAHPNGDGTFPVATPAEPLPDKG